VPPIHGQTQPWLDFDSGYGTQPCNTALPALNSPTPAHSTKMYADIADAAVCDDRPDMIAHECRGRCHGLVSLAA
jgi:hypothetical protein